MNKKLMLPAHRDWALRTSRDLPNSENLLLDSQIHNAEGLEVTNDSQETPEDSDIYIAEELEVSNDSKKIQEESEIHKGEEREVTNNDQESL